MIELNKKELLNGIIAKGMRMRYGSNPNKWVMLRRMWEMKHIVDAGYIDHYLVAFWIFRHYAKLSNINYWGRGAMSSSVVCYCLGLTEVDPLSYGLHAARFVNNEPPMFQFDIEKTRMDEFVNQVEKILVKDASLFNMAGIRPCILGNITPMEYLGKRRQMHIPSDIDDEVARFALSFPDTTNLYETYNRRQNGDAWSRTGIIILDRILAPTYGLLIYQEQMLDILKSLFNLNGIEANLIRRSIQKGDAKQISAYKARILSKCSYQFDSELGWSILISNPKAFLKAHAVSRVLAMHQFEFKN